MAAGTVFGRYQIVAVRGFGGMGTVYEALHTSLRKKVAIKVLNANLAWNEEARQRFLREGELAARIRHHHVVDVHDVGTVDDLPFLVMEFLDGEDLGALLQREGRLSLERTLDVLLPIMAGLAAGHALGIIHRDLKPQNIFLSLRADGEIVPKALDFGVSKQLEEPDLRLTRTGTVCGTVNYMSPEQARGAIDLSPASDQYSVGEILYECLTGQPAYPGDRVLDVLNRVANGGFTPPRQVLPTIDPNIEAIVLKAMAFEPAARFDSLIALGRALLSSGSESARYVWTKTFGPAVSSGEAAGKAADEKTSPAPFVPGAGGTMVLPETPPAVNTGPDAGRSRAARATPSPAEPKIAPETDRYAPPPDSGAKRSSRLAWYVSAAVATAAAIGFAWPSADPPATAVDRAAASPPQPPIEEAPSRPTPPLVAPPETTSAENPRPKIPAIVAPAPSARRKRPAKAAASATKRSDVMRTENRAPLVR